MSRLYAFDCLYTSPVDGGKSSGKFCNLHVSLAKDFRGPLIISCSLLLHLQGDREILAILWDAFLALISCEFRRSFDGYKSCANSSKHWRLPDSKSGNETLRVCSCSLCLPVAPRLGHTNLPKVIYWQLRKVHSAIFQIQNCPSQATGSGMRIRWLLVSSWNWNWIAIDIDWLWLRAWATTRPNHVQPSGDFPGNFRLLLLPHSWLLSTPKNI